MDQRSRMATLQQFKDNEITLLVASDVAARGLDIPAVSHVFNFDVPIHAEDYVHRIGRTGRAGRSGAAFTLVGRRDGKYVESIEKLIDRKIEWLDGVENTASSSDDEDDTGRARRGRGGNKGRGKTNSDDKAPRARRGSKAKAHEDVTYEMPEELASDENESPAPEGEWVEAPKSRGRKKKEAPAKVREHEVVNYETADEMSSDPEQTPAQAPKRETNRPKPANDDRRRNRRNKRGEDDGDQPVGFGDEIPAFMMISSKIG